MSRRPTQDFGLFLPYFRGRSRDAALSILLILIQTATLPPIVVLVQHLFDYSLPRENSRELAFYLAAILVLFTASSLATIANRHVTLSFVKSGIRALRSDLVSRALSRDRRYYSDEDLDRVHARIVQDSERLDCMASALLTQFIPGALVVLGLSGFLAYLNPTLFAVTAVTMGAGFFVGRHLGSTVKTRVQVFHTDFATFSKSIFFLLKFNELIKISAAEKMERRTQDDTIARLKASSQGMAWLGTAHTVIQNYLLTVGGVLVLLIGGLQVMHHAISIGSLLSFYIALGLLGTNARTLIAALPFIIEGLQSTEALAPLLREEPQRSSGRPFDGIKKRITFEGVSFRHSATFALAAVDLTIGKGEIVGLYGASGSGKSTLVNLLLGFYEPEQGAISVDGTDLRDIDGDSYRRAVGTLPQDVSLFPGTIRDNLVYGLDVPDDGEIVAACRAVGIHDHIAQLEAGYDSAIGDRGVKLSGGQKQRLAIARALLRRPQLLILDEPDNNLDEASIVTILRNVRSLGMTTIVVSHNRALRLHFDCAYEFIGGPSGASSIRRDHSTENAAPLVSVILPVFNGEKYLADAVQSVLDQDYAPVELICVNDGSTDETLNILRSFGEQIVVVDSAANGGIGAARNQGLHIARGAMVAFMDADDLWEPDKLAVQMRKLEENPEIDLSFTHMQCFISPELAHETKALRYCPPDPVAGFVAATAVVRRAAFDKVGPFNPDLRVGEFVDWFARFQEAELSHHIEDATLLRRRIHETNTGVTRRGARSDYVKVVREALRRRRQNS
jgi:ABC-type bacteriocin/lantibiotic exporter with double-glycine peptidase domain